MREFSFLGIVATLLAVAGCGDPPEKPKPKTYSIEVQNRVKAILDLKFNGRKYADERVVAKYLEECRSLIVDYTSPRFLLGATVVDAHWDGSLGITAQLLSRQSLKEIPERIKDYKEHGMLNSRFQVFGLVDGFSGTKQVLLIGECEVDTGSLTLSVCMGENEMCEREHFFQH